MVEETHAEGVALPASVREPGVAGGPEGVDDEDGVVRGGAEEVAGEALSLTARGSGETAEFIAHHRLPFRFGPEGGDEEHGVGFWEESGLEASDDRAEFRRLERGGRADTRYRRETHIWGAE